MGVDSIQFWQLIGLCFMSLSYAIIIFVADVILDGKGGRT